MSKKLESNLVGVAGEYLVAGELSKKVAEYTSTSHANWLKGKKRNGTKRKDTSMRKFNDPENKYLEAWDQIKL